ncbi:MAG: 50S ribosomal protein L6 [Planctomycetota bacterium]
MSRIGTQEILLPSGVSVSSTGSSIQVKGPKGTLDFPLFPELQLEVKEKTVQVKPVGDAPRRVRALCGLTRAHLANMVEGVSRGFSKSLAIIGTGWNAKASGSGVELQVGFCHTVQCNPPEGVLVSVPSPNEILVSGADKQKVGQFAANIRRVRPPEPYKGKGIRYKDEEVRRKTGKSLG